MEFRCWFEENGFFVFIDPQDVPRLKKDTQDFLRLNGRCADCYERLQDDWRCADDTHGAIFLALEHRQEFEQLWAHERYREKNRDGVERRGRDSRWMPGFHCDNDIADLLLAQRSQCYFCGCPLDQKTKRKDHLTPISDAAATDWLVNIALVCGLCNGRKSNRRESVFWQSLKKLHGAEWVTKRKREMKPSRLLARRLTAERRKDLSQYCIALQCFLQVELVVLGRAHDVDLSHLGEPRVRWDESGITLNYVGTCICLAPEAHRQISKRDSPERMAPRLAQALFSAELSMGVIKPLKRATEPKPQRQKPIPLIVPD